MKDVFDTHYREAFMQAGLVKDGELQHLISDAATMQVQQSLPALCDEHTYLSSYDQHTHPLSYAISTDHPLEEGWFWDGGS
jgi:hypothetical protein